MDLAEIGRQCTIVIAAMLTEVCPGLGKSHRVHNSLNHAGKVHRGHGRQGISLDIIAVAPECVIRVCDIASALYLEDSI